MTQTNHLYPTLTALVRAVEAMSVKEADGHMQRPAFLTAVAIAARDGIINAASKDPETLWNKYRDKSAKKLDGVVVTIEKSAPQRISELKQVILAAEKPNVDLPSTFNRVRPMLAELKSRNEKLVGNTHDCFVSVARAQLKVEGRDLNDDELRAAVTPQVKSKDRTEIDEWKKLLKAAEVLLKGTDPTENSPGKVAFPSAEAEAVVRIANIKVAELQLFAAKAA